VIIDDLIAALLGIAAGIAVLVLQVVSILIHIILRSSYFASRSKGVKRTSYIISGILALYLILAILRGFIPELASPSFSSAFNTPLIFLTIVALIFSIMTPFALDEQKKGVEKREVAKKEASLYVVFELLSIIVVIGGFSIWVQTTRAPTMEEKYCDRALAAINPDTRENGQALVDFLRITINEEALSKVPLLP